MLWLRADRGITALMGAVVATGTAPPAVTLSGTPTEPLSIEIDISTTGIRGTATFQWKLGGVVQQTGQVTAATFILGTTGITANFPIGAYTNDDVYTSAAQVSAWADQSAAGNNVTQATQANQPVYSIAGGPNNLSALSFNGTTSRMNNGAVNLLTAKRGTYFLVSKTNNIAVGQNSIADAGTSCWTQLAVNKGIANARAIDINGVGTCADTTNSATTSWEAWTFQLTTAPLESLRVNGAAHTLNNSAFTPGVGAGGLFVGVDTAAGNFFNGFINEILVYDRVLSGGEIAQAEAYIRARTAIW